VHEAPNGPIACRAMLLARSRMLCCAAALAVAASLGACGSNNKEKDRVKAAVESFNASLSDGDTGKFCSALTNKLRRSVTRGSGGQQRGGQTCEQVMRVVFVVYGNALKDTNKAKVADVQVSGNKATASVAYKKRKAPLGLAKEAGEWRISAFKLKGL
jgi:hypothetical protein